jgi:hypothetical protein
MYGHVNADTISDASKVFKWTEEVCRALSLTIAAETVSEAQVVLGGIEIPTWQWLVHEIKNIQDIIAKELQGRVFVYIPPEKARFFSDQTVPCVFGQEVQSSFPSAFADIYEAGACLATSRATACVFHLMRVLEIGLASLGAVFGVSLAHTNWAPAIDEIERKIREMHKDPVWRALPDCKDQQEFYAQAASHFGILKDAWRNYTVHARGSYTEEMAALIFDNMRVFMQTLSVKLHE